MNNENFHPHLTEPPLAHALHHYDPQTRTLTYEYNGINILTIKVPGSAEVGFRHGSDGNLNNKPCIQQLYLMLDEPVTAQVTFMLSSATLNMKPNRAGQEEAILGQRGHVLIYGVNGLYDRKQDLMIDWHGCYWAWNGPLVEDNKDTLKVQMTVELGPKPWFINLKMHYYRHHHGFLEHKPWERMPNTKIIAGWCSWEAFRRDVTQQNIQEVSTFFSTHFKAYGLEYIQLDDGYEKMPIPPQANQTVAQGWLVTNNQFPTGHEGIVNTIQSFGLKAGIWTNANVTNPEFAELNKAYLILEPQGKPLLGEWIDYLLDCSEETLNKHVAPYYRGLMALGYDYFKTDAIRHLLMDGLHEAVRMGLISNDEAYDRFRRFMACARKNIGEDAYFLASWGVMAECVGLVDACRIAMDSNPTWAGIRMQLVECARWFHTQRILFLNDPDHICARAQIEWTRSIVSLCSLSGSLFMLSDPLEAYDPERIALIQRALPPLETYTAETGPLDLNMAAFTWTKLHGFAVPRETPVQAESVTTSDALNMAGLYPSMYDQHPFSTLWAFHLNQNQLSWCVAARIATVPLEPSQLPLQKLGLDPELNYLVFDFWAQTYKGIVTNAVTCNALPLGSCQILALREVKGHPQFIGSSRHVSSDAISVYDEIWENRQLKLSLKGIINTEENFYFHIPEGFVLSPLNPTLGTFTITHQGDCLCLKLRFKTEKVEVLFQFE